MLKDVTVSASIDFKFPTNPPKCAKAASPVGAVLSMYALIGAYEPEGWEWLEELKEVLTKNVDYACDFIERQWKGVKVSKPQATYMLFIDCEEWCKEHGKTMDDVQKAGLEVGVLWQDGRAFHGEYCIRMNLALPFTRVQEAFERLDKYVFQV